MLRILRIGSVVLLLSTVAVPAFAQPPARKTQRFQDVDRNINIKQMNRLLESAKTGRNRDVKQLASEILKLGVDKVTGEHKGGFGGNDRPADPETHCTVRAGGNSYHVYLKHKAGYLFISKITK